MGALGESAVHLPCLTPRAASLVALARSPVNAWPVIRVDPGAVLLVLRHLAGDRSSPISAHLSDPAILQEALRQLDAPGAGFVDWSRPECRPIYRSCLLYARLAERLAELSRCCDPESAWVAGLLAPLGWLVLCTATSSPNLMVSVETQRRDWGLDEASIARRLCRRWCLPRWLSAVIGRLDLQPETAQSLGASAAIFRVTQLAVALAQRQGTPLQLAVGVSVTDNAAALGLNAEALESLEIHLGGGEPPAGDVWEMPATVPLLRELLQVALDGRGVTEAPLLQNLENDTDNLHRALSAQSQSEEDRLQTSKLNALAEFAAGAGHEINNPLAVISGQAQYLLLQEPDANRQRSLQTIVNQTQRIHQILTELMQFARPARPQKQAIDVAGLMRETTAALGDQAAQRQVQLVCLPPERPLAIFADPRQARTALAALLRNGMEAASAEGWAGVRVESVAGEFVDLVVEDNGVGPALAEREHLFNPFYSGRQAGRGRGLGLPTAWQLARVNEGSVRYEPDAAGPTRFVLRLPLTQDRPGDGVKATVPESNGRANLPVVEHAAETNGHSPVPHF